MSIDNYAVERLGDILDEIEDLADDQPDIEYAVHRARGYLSDIEDSDDDLLELDPDDLPVADVQDFKSRVLAAIPSGASMKFRMDVEEMLEKFNGVY